MSFNDATASGCGASANSGTAVAAADLPAHPRPAANPGSQDAANAGITHVPGPEARVQPVFEIKCRVVN